MLESSPFAQKMPQHRVKMRKLQKRIYKHRVSNKNTKSVDHKKIKQGLCQTLSKIPLPDFLKGKLSKENLFKIRFNKQQIGNKISLEKMRELVVSQQHEIQSLLKENTQRILKGVQIAMMKLSKKNTQITSDPLSRNQNYQGVMEDMIRQNIFEQNSLESCEQIDSQDLRKEIQKSLNQQLFNF